MQYQILAVPAQEQVVTEVFSGYDHNRRIADGAFYEMENLTADEYPLLCARPRRGAAASIPGCQGLIARDKLVWVQNGLLYIGGTSMGPYMGGVTLTAGEKQLVSMGAYVCVFPDGYYFNTEDYTDNGYMAQENSFTASSSAKVSLTCCQQDGTAISYASSKPESPTNGAYWLDTGAKELRQWSSAQNQWVTVPTTYVKLTANGLGRGISQWDGVRLSGLSGSAAVLNGAQVVQSCGENFLVVIGILNSYTPQTSGTVRVRRTVPDMDYITECGNRLWGCRYGVADGKTVNELYCCKLGDFRNWECYQGIATDSWRASCGTDGRFTGAATLAGSPIFFKEDCFHRVYPSAQGAHRVVEQKARGVQYGSAKSLAVIAERLYYKARDGVCVYDGSLPVLISQAFGTELYRSAAAGGVRGKYYISMQDARDGWHLFVYDTKSGLWHREDATKAVQLARVQDELYFLDGDGKLWSVYASAGTKEGAVSWSAETGVLGFGSVGKKYVSRLNLRMQLPKGSRCDFWVQYDSDGQWRHAGHMEGRRLKSFLLPIRPCRCDHLRFKMTGSGDFRLYSLARLMEYGSDV